jgi:hypothetical protein
MDVQRRQQWRSERSGAASVRHDCESHAQEGRVDALQPNHVE